MSIRNAVIMKFYFVALLSLTSIAALPQQPTPPQANHEMWFDEQIGAENSGLVNGRPYKQKFISSKSNPFFGDGEASGTVLMNGQHYTATLLYDMFQDIVVAKHLHKSGVAWFVELDKLIVEQFTLGPRVFRKHNGLFHEVLFVGQDFQVLARRTKVEQLVKSKSEYQRHDEIFLLDGSRLTRIPSLTKFKNLVETKEDKKRIAAFMRSENIRKRKLTDTNLVALATFVQSIRKTMKPR